MMFLLVVHRQLFLGENEQEEIANNENLTDGAIRGMLFPKEMSAANKRMPDYSYIQKELMRNGVTKKLLWIEYCEDCRISRTPKRLAKNKIASRFLLLPVYYYGKLFRSLFN